MSTNCDVIFIFPIYGQFGAIKKQDIQSVKVTLSLKLSFYLHQLKLESLTLLLWVKVLFVPKNADIFSKNADIRKIKRVLLLEGIFSETSYVCVLMYQVSRFQHNSKEFQTAGPTWLVSPLYALYNANLHFFDKSQTYYSAV